MPIKKLRSDTSNEFNQALSLAQERKIRDEKSVLSLSEPPDALLPGATNSERLRYKNIMDRRAGVHQSLDYVSQKIEEMQEFLDNAFLVSQVKPVQLYRGVFSFGSDADKYDLWLYQNGLFGITGSYTNAEKELLIMDFADKERQKFERLKVKFSAEQTENIKYERTRIPETVRVEVWRRDQGKCAGCGSREKLEYDHIVPVSRGGSNTARNVELLCEACNRSKSDRIQ